MQNISPIDTENHTEAFPPEQALTEQPDAPPTTTEPTQTLTVPPTITEHSQLTTTPIAPPAPALTIAQEIDALTDPSFMTSMARGRASGTLNCC